jgi:hypothetical protein
MIRIAISLAAYEAICATLPVGSVAVAGPQKGRRSARRRSERISPALTRLRGFVVGKAGLGIFLGV